MSASNFIKWLVDKTSINREDVPANPPTNELKRATQCLLEATDKLKQSSDKLEQELKNRFGGELVEFVKALKKDRKDD